MKMDEISKEAYRKKQQLKKCAQELKQMKQEYLEERKWVRPQAYRSAWHTFRQSWQNKTTEELIKKINYCIALITLLDEEIERRENETTNNG
jgi:uncharacterized circularly permuted ATP-grasp superfamily protein